MDHQRAFEKAHVCIVGAGASGLRCADVLLAQGFRVTILEARDRIGGRICQSDALGYTADIGPNWIYAGDVSVQPIFKLAQNTKTPVHYMNDKCLIFGKDGKPLPEEVTARLSSLLWVIFEDAFNASEAARVGNAEPIPKEESLYDYVKREAAARVEDGAERALLVTMSEMWGAYVGEPVWKQSLRFAWMEECCGGVEMFVESNFSKILEELALPALAGADIHLNSYVTNIETPGDKVVVTTADGTSTSYDQIVVSTPLGWLKKNLSAFSPPLPERIVSAVTSLGLSQLEKVYITFPEVFWTSDPQANTSPAYTGWLSPAYATETNPESWPVEIWDLSTFAPPNNHPTILFYIFGDCSRYIVNLIHGKSPEEKHRLLAEWFRPYYSRLPGYDETKEACKPARILATEWFKDPLCGGAAYCNFPAGSEAADEDVLAFRAGCPERRMWFCGEHASPFEECGTVAGAYLSGQTAAEKIIAAYR